MICWGSALAGFVAFPFAFLLFGYAIVYAHRLHYWWTLGRSRQ